jgi:response regulator RpfG family c-di-GMP phosphodiesterase
MASDRILFVDDEANVLAGYQRQLRQQFAVETALGGQPGLELMAQRGPYAVVVADMRMPKMDGVQFLTQVRELAPDTVRMILTGQAELQLAIDAVNAGQIFRFLTKPCPPEILTQALQAGLEQHRLVLAERELLHYTLTGSIKILVDMMSTLSPVAFSRTAHIRRYVRHMVSELALPEAWQYELAALLSQIGCVTLPGEVLLKVYGGEALSENEQRMYAAHPATGRHLLENIPRLEAVAGMVGGQREPYIPAVTPREGTGPVELGAQILHVALDFDQLIAWGLPSASALAEMRGRASRYNPRLLAALDNLPVGKSDKDIVKVELASLGIGMMVCEDIRTAGGVSVISKGQEVTYPVLERLRNIIVQSGLSGTVGVERGSILPV